ncbi:MAG: class II aldolase/adducin family protein [Alphaproteobacteria bacterium]|nr:class II aldolase/adducin family protein [Alphaproteobacteria bacterium]
MPSVDTLKQSLIDAGKILASEGQGDLIFGHVTARLPDDAEHFLMKPHQIGLEEITADNLITVNLEGEKVAGDAPRHIEVFIHSEILRVRPDIGAVVHTHAPNAVAFSALGRPLQGIGHEGTYFHGGLPVFSETADLIIDQTRGKAVARAMADSDVLIMRNHGIVTAGRNIEEATVLALYLERACKSQLLVEACGGAKHICSHEDAVAKAGRVLPQSPRVFDYLVRRVNGEIG